MTKSLGLIGFIVLAGVLAALNELTAQPLGGDGIQVLGVNSCVLGSKSIKSTHFTTANDENTLPILSRLLDSHTSFSTPFPTIPLI